MGLPPIPLPPPSHRHPSMTPSSVWERGRPRKRRTDRQRLDSHLMMSDTSRNDALVCVYVCDMDYIPLLQIQNVKSTRTNSNLVDACMVHVLPTCDVFMISKSCDNCEMIFMNIFSVQNLMHPWILEYFILCQFIWVYSWKLLFLSGKLICPRFLLYICFLWFFLWFLYCVRNILKKSILVVFFNCF